HDEGLGGYPDIKIGLPAQALGDGHLADKLAIGRGSQVLRPDAERGLVARAKAAAADGNGDLPAARQDDGDARGADRTNLRGEEIHLRRADEAGHEEIDGMVIELQWRARLLDIA